MNDKPNKWLLAILLALPAIPLLAVVLILAGVPGPTAFFATGAAWGIAGWIVILTYVFRQPKGATAVKYWVLCQTLGAFCFVISVGVSFFLAESDTLDAIEIAAVAGWLLFELAGFVLLLFSGRRSESTQGVGVHP